MSLIWCWSDIFKMSLRQKPYYSSNSRRYIKRKNLRKIAKVDDENLYENDMTDLDISFYNVGKNFGLW